ncbi:MAG: hypothetical protein MJB14_04960 [Spirochaetes bacterium]|nr:hypothetical protein [Spirochaetota bacterium]
MLKLVNSLKMLLSKPVSTVFIILLGIGLTIPSLFTGLQLDDYIIQDKLTKNETNKDNNGSLFGLFTFVSGDEEEKGRMLDTGQLSWWLFEDAKISFFRPLSELSHWLDYRLWPSHPWLMHLHNVILYGAILGLLALFFKKTIGTPWLAGFALLFFAIDNNHAIAVEWISNRNALLAALWGISVLIFHHQWRTGGSVLSIILSSLFLLLSLLSAEAGLAFTAYLFAYEIFMKNDTWRNKVLALLPYFMIVLPWYLYRSSMGYGAVQAGIYVDPGANPLLFLILLLEKIPIFIFTQFFELDGSLFMIAPFGVTTLIWLMMLFVSVLFFLILFPLLKEDKVAKFFGLSFLLCLIPISAAVPSNRNLFIASIAGAGLLARFVSAVISPENEIYNFKKSKKLSFIFFNILMILNLLSSPISMATHPPIFKNLMENIFTKPVLALSDSINIEGQSIMILNPPRGNYLFYFPYISRAFERPMPKSVRSISAETRKIEIETISQTSIIATVLEEPYHFGEHFTNIAMHAKGSKKAAGQKQVMKDLVVEILELNKKSLPKKVKFTFKNPIEESDIIFVRWNGKKYIQQKMPETGNSIIINER